MRSETFVTTVLVAFVAFPPTEASAQPQPAPPVHPLPPAAPPVFDPVLPASITAMATGGSAGLLGLLTADRAWNVPLALGGVTTAAGGLTLLLAAGEGSRAHADAGVAHVAAGGMVLSLGAGFAVTGVSAMALGGDDDDVDVTGLAMLFTGVATSALATPFVIWGASTWEEDRGVRYASGRRFITGCVLTSLGIITTSAGVMAAAWSSDASGYQSGAAAILSVPVLVLGTAGLGVGLPLMAAGADVIDEADAMPQLELGPGSVRATWKLR